MLEDYANFCYAQIGSYTLDYIDYFEDLRPQLSKADIPISLPEYVSMMLFSTLGVFTFTFFVFGAVLALTGGISGFILGMVMSIIFSVGSLIGFYLYPSVLIKQRASKIRDSLPFATMYMSTLAGTGTSLPELFRILGE